MSILPLRSVFMVAICSLFLSPQLRAGEESARNRAVAAARTIGIRLNKLEERDFFKVPAQRDRGYRGFPTSVETTYRDGLRMDLKAAFADIELAKQISDAGIDEDLLLRELVQSDGQRFFNTPGHVDLESFREKLRLLDKVHQDDELGFSNAIFTLLGSPGDTDAEILGKWLERGKLLTGELYLGAPETLSIARQARCVSDLFLLGSAMRSERVSRLETASPETWQTLQSFFDGELKPKALAYARRRFERDGPMRDRSLPVLAAAAFVVPELSIEKARICNYQTYQKLALGHARGLAALVRAIDAPMADTNLARKALSQILDYRVRPYYIGSLEVREKRTLPCEPDRELETILEKANFFGKNGHREGRAYTNRVEILEQLFLRPSALETRDFLFALKSPESWVDYFRQTLLKSDREKQLSCLESIKNKGTITLRDTKNLFLARCILSHPAYDKNPTLKDLREKIFSDLSEQAPRLAIHHFRTAPRHWDRVDIAFIEMSKLVPGFDLASLNIPTYRKYMYENREFRKAMKEISKDFQGLTESPCPELLDDEIGLFQSDYVYRIGKFNKRLHPDFVTTINRKLDILVTHRESPFAPPQNELRPNMAKPGTPIRELRAANRFFPDAPHSNPILHDLIEGPDGGLGGIGEMFLSAPQGYESREFALDAIARSTDLKLDEALFALALDIGTGDPTPTDLSTAAIRWLNYFAKTQSQARFHSTPDQLAHAIRGAFLCRLVIQSDSFAGTVERVSVAGIDNEVSLLLEKTLANQVRSMRSVLKSIDPSSALNKDTAYIKKRWYILKAWHTESSKWIEAFIADPLLMAEVIRVRSSSEKQTRSYEEIFPAISQFEKLLGEIEHRIQSESQTPQAEDLFTTADFGGLIMGALLTLETETPPMMKQSTDFPDTGQPKLDLSKSVSRNLFADVREALSEAGLQRFAHAVDPSDFPGIERRHETSQENHVEEEEMDATHEFLLESLKGVIARAKGQIESERLTDLKALENVTVRAARADRIFFAGDPERYSLLIDPSLVLHEWNNRSKIETLAEFRTIETRSQAQTQIYRTRRVRKDLEFEREQLFQERQDLADRIELAKKWAAENEADFDPEAVIDVIIAKEDRIVELEGEIAVYQETETLFRLHHLQLAQELQRHRRAHSDLLESAKRDILLAKSAEPELPEPEETQPVAIFQRGRNPEIVTPSWPRPTVYPTTNTSTSSRGSYFQRVFGGRGRR